MPTPNLPPRCRHLHADGRQCGSPALRAQPLCFQHRAAREPLPSKRLDGRHIPQLPVPDDFPSIQRGIAEVLRLLAEEEITESRARALFAGLSLASQNLARRHRREDREDRRRQSEENPAEPVADFTNHPQLGPLALEETPAGPAHPVQQNQDLSDNRQVFPEPIPEPAPVPAPANRFPPSSSLSAADDEKIGAMYLELSESFSDKNRLFIQEKTAELEAHFQTRLEQALAHREEALRQTQVEALTSLYGPQLPCFQPTMV